VPRILDLQISIPRLIGRVILAFILAGIDFFIFYILISPKDTFIQHYLPATFSSHLTTAMSSFVSPTLPFIGLVIAVLIFFDQIFKQTRIEGAFLMIMGALFAWYTYAIFEGGTMNLNIPKGLIQNISGNITIHATLIMWLFILPSLLTVVKGALMLYSSNKRKPQVQKQPVVVQASTT
jgi:drug/metabolite transporter (DMT)-like permease